MLLEDADADYREIGNVDGITPLYVAAQEGHCACVKLLLACADADYRKIGNRRAALTLIPDVAVDRQDVRVKFLIGGAYGSYRVDSTRVADLVQR